MKEYLCDCGHKGSERDFPLAPFDANAKWLCPKCGTEILVRHMVRYRRETGSNPIGKPYYPLLPDFSNVAKDRPRWRSWNEKEK